MRAGRLVSLLLLLQTRGRMTARELAAELEVSMRTVYRDVEALGSSGIPVYAERGPEGGYRLLEGYRTRLTGLTSEEAQSLFLTGMPGPAAELGLGSAIAAAELKLLAALPDGMRERAGRMRQRFHLDAPGWYRDPDRVPHLAVVAQAVWEERRLRIAYRRWSAPAPVERCIEPLGLVLKGGLWYVVARAEEPRPSVRTYRIRQIGEAELLDERFARPAGFALAEFWRESSERFEEELYGCEAVVRITEAALGALAGGAAPVVARTLRETAGEPDAEGRLRAVYRYELPEQARAELLPHGAAVEVLEPPELRSLMAEAARSLAARYDEGPGVLRG